MTIANGKRLRFFLTGFFVAILSCPVYAQTDTPEVVVDTSVLDEMPRSSGGDFATPRLTEPQPQRRSPLLTAPPGYNPPPQMPFPSEGATSFPIKVKVRTDSTDPSLDASPKVAVPKSPPVEKAESFDPPLPQHKPIFIVQPGAPAKPEAPKVETVKAEEPAPQSKELLQPVIEQPIVPSGPPEPVKETIAVPEVRAIPPQPIDDMVEAEVASTPQPLPPEMKSPPPLPPRRPAIQKASDEFVKQARETLKEQQAQQQQIDQQQEAEAASKIVRVPATTMPPVVIPPAENPVAEPVAPPPAPAMMPRPPEPGMATPKSPDGSKAYAIVTPEKEELVRTIEKIADQAARKPVKSPPPQPAKVVTTPAEPIPADMPPPDKIVQMALADTPPQETGITKTHATAMLKAEPESIILGFRQAEDIIQPEAMTILEKSVLPVLKNNASLRLQIQSFANPTDDSANSARRLSLARALALRTWLLDHGIEARRIDIRALGSETQKQPVDRAELYLFDPAKIR